MIRCVSCSAVDVLEMSVVRGVCGVSDMCMSLARSGRCWCPHDRLALLLGVEVVDTICTGFARPL